MSARRSLRTHFAYTSPTLRLHLAYTSPYHLSTASLSDNSRGTDLANLIKGKDDVGLCKAPAQPLPRLEPAALTLP